MFEKRMKSSRSSLVQLLWKREGYSVGRHHRVWLECAVPEGDDDELCSLAPGGATIDEKETVVDVVGGGRGRGRLSFNRDV